jgi:hypothetical protein
MTATHAMTAPQKLEALSHRWYGYLIAMALLSVVSSVLGGFSLLGLAVGGLSLFVNATCLVFSLGIAYFLSSRLMNRSSLTRLALIGLGSLCTVVGVFGFFAAGKNCLVHFGLGSLHELAIVATGTYMYATTVQTLMDRSVKAYIG